MSGPAVAHTYRYPFPSALVAAGARADLRLSTSGRPDAGAPFFAATLARPRLVADLLRGLSLVVGARFHVPAAMRERLIALADPVVTSGGGDHPLRFEGFSSCASVYARVDLHPGAFSAVDEASPGTTNVDFNADMRAALARVRDGEEVRLEVGAREVALARGAERVVERKVPLPVRWLKGFVETQAYQVRMVERLAVKGGEALRFLRALPRASTKKHTSWVVPAGRGLRLGQTPAKGGVPVVGTERLRALEPLAAHARGLRVFADDAEGASAWELDLDVAHFTLVLSPETWRGFSGEGQVLSTLAARRDEALLGKVRAALRWSPVVRPDELARTVRADPARVAGALATLGARGLVGWDLTAGAWFHRELPFDLSAVEELQPRLVAARKLLAGGGVVLGAAEAKVQGSDVTHRVRVADGRCTCPWFSKHQGKRGPCKHALAVQLALEEEEWGSPGESSSARPSSGGRSPGRRSS